MLCGVFLICLICVSFWRLIKKKKKTRGDDAIVRRQSAQLAILAPLADISSLGLVDDFPCQEIQLPVWYRATVCFRWSWQILQICRRANLTAGSWRRQTACAGCRCCPVCCWRARMSAACTCGGASCPGETLTGAPDTPGSPSHSWLGFLPAPAVILIRPVFQ